MICFLTCIGCCRVAGTVGLASTAVMGIEDSYNGPLEPVYRAALSLGIANQLTNVLRDVGEDIDERNRIYLPQEELKRFGISEAQASCTLSHSPQFRTLLSDTITQWLLCEKANCLMSTARMQE